MLAPSKNENSERPFPPKPDDNCGFAEFFEWMRACQRWKRDTGWKSAPSIERSVHRSRHRDDYLNIHSGENCDGWGL